MKFSKQSSIIFLAAFAGTINFVTLQCFAAHRSVGNLPKLNSLVAFWPFDAESLTKDVVGNRSSSLGLRIEAGMLNSRPGPVLGKPGTSFVNIRDKKFLAYYFDFTLIPTGSFTMTFYYWPSNYSSGLTSRAGIFSWENPGIHAIPTNTTAVPSRFISLGAYLLTATNSIQMTWTDINSVYHSPNTNNARLRTNDWNYLAIAFDNTLGIINVLDETGLAIWTSLDYFPISNPTSIKPGAVMLNVGSIRPPGAASPDNMRNGDALACLTLYSELLTSMEIIQISKACPAQ